MNQDMSELDEAINEKTSEIANAIAAAVFKAVMVEVEKRMAQMATSFEQRGDCTDG
jgi:hypothetical protein